MNQKLTDEQIREVCRELLEQQRHVTIQNIRDVLWELYGAGGRTSRISPLLEEMREAVPYGGIGNRPGENDQ